jgi:hypothetical protein
MPDASLANVERWAAEVPVPTYAIVDQTAIQVTDGTVEIISEGHWTLFAERSPLGRISPKQGCRTEDDRRSTSERLVRRGSEH